MQFSMQFPQGMTPQQQQQYMLQQRMPPLTHPAHPSHPHHAAFMHQHQQHMLRMQQAKFMAMNGGAMPPQTPPAYAQAPMAPNPQQMAMMQQHQMWQMQMQQQQQPNPTVPMMMPGTVPPQPGLTQMMPPQQYNMAAAMMPQ